MADPEGRAQQGRTPSFEDRYPSVASEARRFRSRQANRRAALLLLAGLVVAVLAVALLT